MGIILIGNPHFLYIFLPQLLHISKKSITFAVQSKGKARGQEQQEKN